MSSASLRTAALVAGGCFVSGVAFAQSAGPAANSATDNPVIAYAQNGGAAALIAKARQKGRIRVIVGLRMAMQPEHAATPAVVEQQAQALLAMQNGVASRVLGRPGGDDVVSFTFIPYMSMFVNAGQAARLASDADVVSIQEDIPRPPLDTASIPLIHADDVWAQSEDGTGYKIAIIDTGVQKSHPVLSRKVVSEACYSTNSGADIVSMCAGGATSSIATGAGVNCLITITSCDHGTHVASIAAAMQTADLIGVAKGAQIIAIKAFTRFNLAADCGTAPAPCARSYTTDQIQALQRVYALRNRFLISSANMSLGGGKHATTCDADNPALTTAITNLRGAKIATLIASGNDGFEGFIGSPACISTAIAVGNSTKDDLVARSSNHSDLVKLLAPGTDIYAAVPHDAFGTKTGTSMATPAVAGAFAIMRQTKPGAAVDDILAALVCSGKTIDHKQKPGQPAINPVKPRIDLLGAYDFIQKVPDAKRVWLFSTDDEALDWTPFLGTWAVRGGRYAQAPIQTGWIGTSVADCNSSLEVSASMTRTDPGTDFFSNTGIVFKSTFDYTGHLVSGYWVAYNKCRTASNGICTGDPSDPPGQAVFWRLDSADWQNGSPDGTLLCGAQAPVNVNGLNSVKLVTNGSTHTFMLNGNPVCTVTDATYTTGPVMAAAFIAAPGGHSYQLNTFTTTAHDTPSIPSSAVMDPASFAPRAVPSGMSPSGSRPVARVD